LAGRATDVNAVAARPAHDGQAAGARVAAGARARIAEQREAHATAGHRRLELGGRDELTALAVGEDEHRAPVAHDERTGLGGGARRHLVGHAGRRLAQEGRECRHAPG
jgi:hypothetical protein